MVADDFTGSADAANYFCVGGRKVRVAFDSDQPWDFSLCENVVQVFDAESRAVTLETASMSIFRAGRQLVDHGMGEVALYKKVDSTMRGHVGAEIEALLRSSGRYVALLAPAFPGNGRVVMDGRLLVEGVPVSQTPFARDPHSPIDRDHVAEIVGRTTNLPISLMGISTIRKGIRAVRNFLDTIGEERAIVIADTQTDADLEVIANAIADNLDILPCGAAAFARQLAPLWRASDRAPQIEEGSMALPDCKRVVVTVGSAHPVSAHQIAYLLEHSESSSVVLSTSQLAEPEARSTEIERAVRALETSRDPIVSLSLSKERVKLDQGQQRHFEQDLATVVGQYLSSLDLDENLPVGLVATGGDTAFALCTAMSAKAFWPQGEISTGMPWSWLETDTRMFPIVSKAGGFGHVDALYLAVRALMGKMFQP